MSDAQRRLNLTVLHESLSVCRLDPHEDIPSWGDHASFTCITRTADELSIIAPSNVVSDRVRRSDGWRALKLEGPFAFSEHGVLAAVLTPLAHAEIPILAICTYDTDYVLVQEPNITHTVKALENAGHRVGHEV